MNTHFSELAENRGALFYAVKREKLYYKPFRTN